MSPKPIGIRIAEMQQIYTELERLQLGPQYDEIRAFQRVCNEYVRTGKAVSGAIPIPSLQRRLVYHFPSSSYQKCVACLRA